MLKYNLIPFTKVACLRFSQDDLLTVEYKLFHSSNEFIAGFVGHTAKTARHTMTRSGLKKTEIVIAPLLQKCDKQLDSKKVKDLQDMLKYMPLLDREYYKTLNIQ